MRYVRQPLWALILIIISAALVMAAPQQQNQQPAQTAETTGETTGEISNKVTFDEQGNLIVDPAKIDLSGVSSILLDVRLAEGRAHIDSDGKIVIKGQYPYDCLVYTQLMLANDWHKTVEQIKANSKPATVSTPETKQ